MLSRFVITFLLKSKRLLISWLQSPSAVILEPRKIKSDTVSTVYPSIFHEVMGSDAMILVLWMLSFKPTLSLSSFYYYYQAVLNRCSRVLLCEPTDCRPPGSSVHGIVQARALEWVTVSSSGRSSRSRDGTCVSYVSWTGRRVLYTPATWEAPFLSPSLLNRWFSALVIVLISGHAGSLLLCGAFV